MMRGLAIVMALALPLLSAGASPLLPQGQSADQRLADARKEAADSARELDRLDKAVGAATDEVARRKAQQAAAAAAITDAEARIAEADAQVRLTLAQAALGKQRLDQQRAPMSALLGGLVSIGREPPILALFDGTSTEELVRVKTLFDSIGPVIQQRTAKLSADYQQQQNLAQVAQAARAKLAEGRALLADRQRAFVQLEQSAAAQVATLTSQSISAGDRVLADREGLLGAQDSATDQAAAMTRARQIAQYGLLPARPVAGDAPLPAADFAYILPVDATVIDGVGSINRAGIIARGTQFDSRQGATVVAPASGTVRFSGPFRRSPGIVIIDHGNGRTTLLLGVASRLPKGERVEMGQPIGLATGPIGVEFRDNGRILSPAFIAASSPPLSNANNTR